MQKLIDGYRMFRSEAFPRQEALYRELAGGQKPSTLFMTCSDSRVQPTDFVSAGPGELFSGRSLGNIIPAGNGPETEARSVVEYAVVALGVSDVVVCGHSGCGAMKALLDPASLKDLPTVAAWLAHAGDTLARVQRKHGGLQGKALLDATVRENVLVQLEHLRRLPCVAGALAEGRLAVHGWVFEIETGMVYVHDPAGDRFVPLDEAQT